MLRLNRFAIISFFVILSLCFSLLNTQVVFADDAPPPTEEAQVEETPAEEIIIEETPTEEIPPTQEVDDPESSTEEEDLSIAEVLQSTENTSVVVFDENGDAVPLATQQAQEIAVIADHSSKLKDFGALSKLEHPRKYKHVFPKLRHLKFVL